MKLVFCGTPQFAIPTLEGLVREHEVALVVTQPDRPSGRGMAVAAPPVKVAAEELKLAVIQPAGIKNNAAFRAQIERLDPEAIIVVGYGRMIPPWVLDLPRHGNINLHASLLPKYRGAAPIQWAIANGEIISGNTTMRLNAGLDTGDILLQRALPIEAEDTALTYAPRLAKEGAELVLETLRGLPTGTVVGRPQDHFKATFAPILKKEDGRIDFQLTAREIHNRLRGFQPWPGTFTTFRGKQLAITAANLVKDGPKLTPGGIAFNDGRLFAGCGSGTALEIAEVQPEGKKKMPARDFANGARLQTVERFA